MLAARSALQTLAVSLFALGITSICLGLYSLVPAFDVVDFPMPFKVWFSRRRRARNRRYCTAFHRQADRGALGTS
jgi:hypothetical protein